MLLLLGAMPARAQTPPAPDWTSAQLDELAARLRAIPESHASFSETRYLAALSMPLQSSGTLSYRRPDELEKITTAPRPERMVVQGGQLTLATGEQPPQSFELDSRPEIRALVETVRGALSGDIALLQTLYAIRGEGSLGGWRLTLTPRDPNLARMLRLVRIDGNWADLRFIQIVATNGDDDRMTITPAP